MNPTRSASAASPAWARSSTTSSPWAPIGTVVIILNIPLFLLGWKLLGGHLLVSSLYSMFISSIFIDILHMIHTFEPMEPILGCIFEIGRAHV